ncbi:MAG TPA: beta-ketoacyl synthase N-terminal-like domain-containing protein [Archangium sp.]|uniref:beta-ketoacyl synthase N-terminal-like domain-containing protein n=1 Tax=Archangium sp. TaxID=1872627 RepID=UPI002E374328|nr:beta-ketoacyl synthase N-terminal-like domain-containing protein [Archangium sp.]HEX5748768.1 beta-ketoacyl synthase N-terminal-like domain-containing protein [Archangium sp.]
MGLRWTPACAALRAGINRKRVSPYMDNQGREIVISHLRDILDLEATPTQRWLFFLTHALQDVLEQIGAAAFEQLPLLIALPASTANTPYSADFLVRELSARLGVVLHPRRVRIFTEGSQGGYTALAAGRELVRRREVPACLVAGAESMMCARTVLRLYEQRRLLTEDNSDGVIPGEAAACVLLSSHKQGLAVIRGMGFAQEPSSLENDVPLRADGLTAAARAALEEAGLALHQIDFRFSDAAGESFYFKEQTLLVSRVLRERKEDFPLWLCAEVLGDTGAAAGLCGMVWAIAGWARRYAPGPRAIGLAGNAQGRRAAVIIEAME